MKRLLNIGYVLITFSLPCIAASQATALLITTTAAPVLQEKEGVLYRCNKFGDIFPEWHSIEPTALSERLLKFAAAIEPTGAPIIITVPHAQSAVFDALTKANFTFVHGNNTETRWMIKNKATIPDPYTAIAGGEVVVLNEKGEMLVVEEHTRKNRMSFPGGHVDPQEYSRHAACRELLEEVGIIVKPEDLKLIALVNRVNANKEGASDYNHYYLAKVVSREVKSDNKEILKTCWIPVQKLAQGGKIDNLESYPIVQFLAQHIANGCKKSQKHVIPNYRRPETPSWPQGDPADIMYIELFQQDVVLPTSRLKPLFLAAIALSGLATYCYRTSRLVKVTA